MKRIQILLLAFVIGTIGLVLGATSRSERKITNSSRTTVTPQQQDPAGTVNGAEHPELIPDNAAYMMLFRLLSNRQSEVEKNSIRAYIRQMGLGKQWKCDDCPPSVGVGDADIEALLATADEFNRRVSILDAQAAEIKNAMRSDPTPEAIAQLRQLQ